VYLGAAGSGYILPVQRLEGYNTSDLNWGTSFGVPVTVSFWFRGNVGGTYCSAVRCPDQPQVYNTNFSIQANTWTYVTYTVPPPPNGTTIFTGSSKGIELFIGNYNNWTVIPPVNTWQANYYQLAPQTANWWTQAGNYIEFTGVQLEKGTVATPFEVRPYATELALCQRYYQKTYNIGTPPGTNVSGVGAIVVTAPNSVIVPGAQFRTTMRAAPTIVTYNPYSTTSGVIGIYSSGGDTGAAAADAGTIGDSGFRYIAVTVTSGVIYQYHYTANAEL
jgi:hypothetical protein